MSPSQTGKAIIISAPSGAGKTTIVRALLDAGLPMEFSISATSRPPRGEEKEGVDYHFLGIEGFKQMIDRDGFVEWEEVYPDQFYGTLKSELERIWKTDRAVIFDVDVYGGLHLKEILGSKALSIFILPPSIDELERRLRGRQTESEEKLQVRLQKAGKELETAPEFDVQIVNDDLDRAIGETIDTVTKFLGS